MLYSWTHMASVGVKWLVFVLLRPLLQAFARRAVVKIDELSQIMSLSSEPQSKETEKAFRLATVKVSLPVPIFVMLAFDNPFCL